MDKKRFKQNYALSLSLLQAIFLFDEGTYFSIQTKLSGLHKSGGEKTCESKL